MLSLALLPESQASVERKVKVSSNDTTAGYLNGKLVAGTGITFTEGSDGADETLTIAGTAGAADGAPTCLYIEGSTNNNSEQILCSTDPTADRQINFPDATLAASDILTGSAANTFVYTNLGNQNILIGDGSGAPTAASLSGDATMSNAGVVAIANNAVALTTDTTGNYVLDVADGTGIDGTASGEGATYTPSLDFTEVTGNKTWGDGTDASNAWTYNLSGTDPILTAGSGMFTMSHDLTISGDDLFMLTNTSGYLLVADGTNFNPVALSGDATLDGTGALTVANNSVDGTDIALGSDAQGDVMYYNGTDWARLAASTSGFVLSTNGAGANPSWIAATASTGGDITAVGPGCANGMCWTDGVATTGTDLLIWEGTSDNSSEFSVVVPSDPGSDIAITMPTTTSTLSTLALSETLTNKTIQGGDGAASATRISGSNILGIRSHNTDCTALTDGKANEACFEEDANTLYVCEPSAGDCDTAGEWTLTTAAGGYATIEEEASGLTQRTILNFAGAEITCADDTTKTTCTVASTDEIDSADIDTSSEIATIVGDETGTGVIVFGTGPVITLGANSTIVNGTNPTVDAAGEISEDTTGPQLLFGAAANVLSPTYSFSFRIDNQVASDDNFAFWNAPAAVTITAVGCHFAGTGTTAATITLEDDDGNAMTHTSPTCTAAGTDFTFQSVTAANALVSGEGLRFDTTNTPSPTTDDYIYTIKYTIDRT